MNQEDDRLFPTKNIEYGLGAVLSDIDILREKYTDNIVIHPYHPEQLQNCSYDVTLGENYYIHTYQTYDKKSRKWIDQPAYFNPWNVSHVHEYWGKPCIASTVTEEEVKKLGLKLGERYILLHPNKTILAHTNEFIGGRSHITTMMKARSSMGRSNVTICRDAGWGDIGYINRWTMVITNSGETNVVLPVGARVAQIIFLSSSKPGNSYQGKYQFTSDLDKLVAEWTPESMLPKLHVEPTVS